MKTKLYYRWLVTILLPLVVLSVGCGANTSFSKSVSTADRLTVRDRTRPDAAMGFRGNRVQQYVQAISTAKRDRTKYRCAFSHSIEFYQEDRLLGTILVCGDLFLIGGIQYRDDTHTVRALDELLQYAGGDSSEKSE